MKTFLSVLLILCCLGITVAGTTPATAAPNTFRPGLHVRSDGIVMLGNRVFYGYGLNLFSTFGYHLDSYFRYGDPLDALEHQYKKDFEMCKKYNLPFVRVPFSTWGANSYELFEKDRETFFRLLDDIVAEAERQEIGIVVSLLWNQDALPYYVSEKRSAMGDPESKTVRFAKEYVAAIVQRYKDSPAIWGWEIGNEYNLTADLCSKDLTEFLPHEVFKVGEWDYYDYYTSDELLVFYQEIADTIRQYDDYRLITNGNGEMRSAAYNLRYYSRGLMTEKHSWPLNWRGDTYEQFQEMIQFYTPEPMDTLSFHYQAVNESGFLTTMHAGGTRYPLREAFAKYVEASRSQGLATFFGEFGDFIEMEHKASPEEVQQAFRSLLDDMMAADIQIACGWFQWPKDFEVRENGRDRFLHSEEGLDYLVNRYKMEQLAQVNEAFQKENKQNAQLYWVVMKNRAPVPPDEPAPQETAPATEAQEAAATDGPKDSPAEPDAKPRKEKGLAVWLAGGAAAAAVAGSGWCLTRKKKAKPRG